MKDLSGNIKFYMANWDSNVGLSVLNIIYGFLTVVIIS